MRKTVLTFGIISGAIIEIIGLATWFLVVEKNGDLDLSYGYLFGYINMIVALSMVFFGIRQYRDRYQEGIISFGKAFKVGFLIALIASVIYVIGWMILYNTNDVAHNFYSQYLEHMKMEWAASGMTPEQISAKAEGFAKNMEMYKNPIIMAGMTLMEILPVGLLITLISALILKKKINVETR
jgi:predicted Co/Zn/Cd cation transporter (cation efflux family)